MSGSGKTGQCSRLRDAEMLLVLGCEVSCHPERERGICCEHRRHGWRLQQIFRCARNDTTLKLKLKVKLKPKPKLLRTGCPDGSGLGSGFGGSAVAQADDASARAEAVEF